MKKATELQPSLFNIEDKSVEKQQESTRGTLKPDDPALGEGVVGIETAPLLQAAPITAQIEVSTENPALVVPVPVKTPVKEKGPIKLAFGPVAQPTPVIVPDATPKIVPVGYDLHSKQGKKLTEQEVWNELSAKTSEYIKYMEYCHAQEYEVKWVDEYFVHLQYLQGLYVLLVPIDREKVESFRLAVRKEIVKVETEMRKLHSRLEVTIGDKLNDQALALGLRHIRLYDQYEALSYALRANESGNGR